MPSSVYVLAFSILAAVTVHVFTLHPEESPAVTLHHEF